MATGGGMPGKPQGLNGQMQGGGEELLQERASYEGREDDNGVLSPRADDGSGRSKEVRAVDVRIDSAAGAPPIQMVKRAKVR